MKRCFFPCLLLLPFLFGCGERSGSLLLHPDLVDLEGGEGTTVFRNSTQDTLRLKGSFYTYFPVQEVNFEFAIAPGEEDTLRLTFHYPDFIALESHNFRVFNAPNSLLVCDFRGVARDSLRIDYAGALADANAYYLAHHLEFGPSYESTPYYQVGQRLEDFNTFPQLADSINLRGLEFLRAYPEPLPAWFRRHEQERLGYNAAFRKYNVPFAKEAAEGRPLPVGNSYYDFEQEHALEAEGMLLNTEYLWYALFYLNRRALLLSEDRSRLLPNMISVIDSMAGGTATGDVLKLRVLSDLHRTSKTLYDSMASHTAFHAPATKKLLHQLFSGKGALEGKAAPSFTLKDVKGHEVSLSDFRDDVVIVNFWATWCKGCMQEFPYENELHRAFKDRGLTMINVCLQSDEKKWKALSRDHDLQMVNLFVEAHQLPALQRQYDVSYLPKSLLLKPGLLVVDDAFKKASLLSKEEMEGLLQKHKEN